MPNLLAGNNHIQPCKQRIANLRAHISGTDFMYTEHMFNYHYIINYRHMIHCVLCVQLHPTFHIDFDVWREKGITVDRIAPSDVKEHSQNPGQVVFYYSMIRAAIDNENITKCGECAPAHPHAFTFNMEI